MARRRCVSRSENGPQWLRVVSCSGVSGSHGAGLRSTEGTRHPSLRNKPALIMRGGFPCLRWGPVPAARSRLRRLWFRHRLQLQRPFDLLLGHAALGESPPRMVPRALSSQKQLRRRHPPFRKPWLNQLEGRLPGPLSTSAREPFWAAANSHGHHGRTPRRTPRRYLPPSNGQSLPLRGGACANVVTRRYMADQAENMLFSSPEAPGGDHQKPPFSRKAA